jgi:hypothetical protein
MTAVLAHAAFDVRITLPVMQTGDVAEYSDSYCITLIEFIALKNHLLARNSVTPRMAAQFRRVRAADLR